jgi:hypothetical protein
MNCAVYDKLLVHEEFVVLWHTAPDLLLHYQFFDFCFQIDEGSLEILSTSQICLLTYILEFQKAKVWIREWTERLTRTHAHTSLWLLRTPPPPPTAFPTQMLHYWSKECSLLQCSPLEVCRRFVGSSFLHSHHYGSRSRRVAIVPELRNLHPPTEHAPHLCFLQRVPWGSNLLSLK